LLVGPTAQAQDPKADKKAGETTITGCLKATSGTYTLTDKAGKTVSVTGPPELAKHANHQVELTGTMSKKGDQEQFSATAIKHISPTCQP
jgi:hypothetical protein